MVALRLVAANRVPAGRSDTPMPGFVADRTSLADSIVHLASGAGRKGGAAAVREDGEPPRRPGRHGWIGDLIIRLGGLGAIALSAVAFAWLYRLVHAVPGREATLGQYLLAAVGFLSASIGSGLLALGRHVHDRIELSERWRPAPSAPRRFLPGEESQLSAPSSR
jgi:hypothetical protein